MSNTLTLNALAERFELQLAGDGAVDINGVGTLGNAQSGQLSFLSNPSYRGELKCTQASAVVLTREALPDCPTNALISENPYVDYARIAALFTLNDAAEPGIHPSASVASSAVIGQRVSIGPNVVVGERSDIQDGATIGPNCVIGRDSTIGAGSRLVTNVTIVDQVRLGRRVIVHPGAVIGADGFGLAFDRDHWIKVPQLGGVQIGDDCEIGANTTIDRGAIEDTVLEDDVRLDNLVQVGHNVYIGAHTAIAGCVGIAGSARIGRYCLIAGGAGIGGHLEIADKVTVKAMGMVTRSIKQPGEYGSGVEAQPHQEWQRNLARLRKLDTLVRRLLKLERQKDKQ